MDKKKTNLISDVLTKLQDSYNDITVTGYLIKSACSLFDYIKDKDLSDADFQLLFFIANKIGVPQYYSMLQDKFKQNTKIYNWNLETLTSACSQAELMIEDRVLHRFQKTILDLYREGEVNKYFLSASTSFGKTYMMYEIIKKLKYKNILLIFPTIALLSENHEKILTDKNLSHYTVHTLSQQATSESEYNIFIFTPERFLSFIENNGKYDMDFVFVDEVYKLDNDFLIEQEQQENERDTAYRLALFLSNLKSYCDVLLCGPYIDMVAGSSFENFLRDNNIKVLDYNNIELVNKARFVGSNSNTSALKKVLKEKHENSETALVYCQTPNLAESYAKKLSDADIFPIINQNNDFRLFIEHLERVYDTDWGLIFCLKHGIAFHHGLVPKYIQKEIIKFFNNGVLKVIVSTTTITEGVNTSAKNIVVLHHKKGMKKLKKFDAQNIIGRAGRFLEHYLGNVVILDKEVENILDDPSPNTLRHKNYDISTDKDPCDIMNVEPKYLNAKDCELKKEQLSLIELYSFPAYVVERSKIFSISDKIFIYKALQELSNEDIRKLRSFMKNLQGALFIEKPGFEVMVSILRGMQIKDKQLVYFFGLFEQTGISRIFYALTTYIKEGFNGMLKFNLKRHKIDAAMRHTSRNVFNTFKYGLVKYLTLFDLMYRHFIACATGEKVEDINGLQPLIFKLEYNAKTERGVIASDYGVPNNVIKYFDNELGLDRLDDYEQNFISKIEQLLPEIKN